MNYFYKKSNNKGFTLVEILAIVVVIGIICLITIPSLIGTMENAQKNAFKESVNGLIRSVRNDSDYNNYEDGTYKVNNGILYDSKSNKIQTSGGEKENGVLYINSNGLIAAAVNNGKWCAIKNYNNNSLEIKDYKDGECEINLSICNAKSFATDSWETISCAVKNNELDKYKVGDEKDVTLTGEYAGTYKVRIANTSTPSECNTENFSQSACGFVVEFKDIITKTKMNSNGTTKGGWPDSELYSLVSTNIYNSLPENLKKEIKETRVISSHGSQDTNDFISTDKLYLFSFIEVWGKNLENGDIENTRQLDYYKGINIIENYKIAARKNYLGSKSSWWFRSINSNHDFFYYVTVNDQLGSCLANNIIGVAPAFRIG